MTDRTKKFLAIAAGAVVLVVAVLVVLAKVLITPERIKTALIPRAEQALNRTVEIGDVEISLFSGIVVKDFVIREKSAESPFVSAGRVSLQYQFWPLLRKRIVIDEILLEQPQIRIERLADGTFNFSDLLSREKKDEAPAEPETAPEDRRDIDLLISTVILEDGAVSVVDHQAMEGKVFEYQVRAVNLRIDDLSLEKDFPYRFAASLGEAPLALSGNANLQEKTVQAKISLAGFDVVPFKPYFAEKVPGRLHSMLVDLELSLAGDAQRLASEGNITLRNVSMELQALPEIPLENAELGIQYALKLDQPASTLDLSESRVTFNGIPVTLAGKLTNFPAASTADLTCNLPDLDLRKAMAALPAGLRKKFAELDPAGSLNARLRLVGALAEGPALLHDGEIRLNEVQANLAGQRSALSGLLTLQKDTLTGKDLAAAIGQNRAQIDLQVKNFMVKPIDITTALTSQRINLDALVQGGGAPAAGEGAPPDKKPSAGPGDTAEEIGPFDLPIRLSGTARLGQALYKGLTIEQLRARYRLENNILLLDELTGNVAGGSFSETARVDLRKKGLEYTAKLSTRGIQANPLVSALFPKAAGTVFGGIDLDLDLAGKGTRPAAIRQSLTATGDVLLQNGKLTGTNLVNGLAGFLDLGELRELELQKAEGQFAVKNGKMAVDSEMAGKQLQLFPKGSVGLDGELDLDLGLRLSPPLMEKIARGGKFPSLLKDEKGWGQIPLNVAGTAQKPRFALDTRALKAGAQEKAKEKLQKTLQEKLFDKKKKETTGETTDKQGEQEARKPEEKLLEGVFKGLFGN